VSASTLVSYSIAPPDGRRLSTLVWQLETSIRTLRRHNTEVPIVVFLYGIPATEFTINLDRLGVYVREMGTYRAVLDRLHAEGTVLERLKTLHRFLDLGALSEWDPERVLCLDADTLFFGDVAALFERYQEGDCYAREEVMTRRSRDGYRPDLMIGEDALAQLAADECIVAIPPFNAGVVLLSRRAWHELAKLESTLVDYAWRFVAWMALHPQDVEATGYAEGEGVEVLRTQIEKGLVTDALERALPFPSHNRWLVGEMNLWMTLGHVADLSYSDFSPAHVRQGAETFTNEGLISSAQSPELVVAHYFNRQTAEVRWHMTTGELIRELDHPEVVDQQMLAPIPDEFLTSRLVAHGNGLAVYEDLIDPGLMWALQTESMSAFWDARVDEQWFDDRGDGRGGNPSMQLLRGSGGPRQTALYQSEWLSLFLSQESGLNVVPSGGRGTYSYYTRAGDFLGLHLDVDYCDLVLLTVLSDNSEPDDPAGALVVYPNAIGTALSAIRQNPEAGATYLKFRRGQSIVMLGGLVPHRVVPVNQGQARVLSVLCFTATAPD
jgi:hypothetical protein